MKIFHGNIEELAEQNKNFREVLFTGQFSQLVVMSLKSGEDIGEEIHHHVDQFFRIESGEGKVIIDNQEYLLKDGMAIIVPAGCQHNIINIGEDDLRLYTIYSPANHPEGTIHQTKKEAEESEGEHHH